MTGHVQGVFFRDTARTMARDAGVAGWIRNRSDGSVEAVFEGEDSAVGRMVAWCREGPGGAVVRDVRTRDEAEEGLSGFQVR